MLSILDVAECWNSIIPHRYGLHPYVDDSYLIAFITYLSAFMLPHRGVPILVHMYIMKSHASHVGLYISLYISLPIYN